MHGGFAFILYLYGALSARLGYYGMTLTPLYFIAARVTP